MSRLIAFSGGYGSGKSTAIEIFRDHNLEESVRLIKFAQPIYDIQEFAYRRISSVVKRPDDFVKDRKLLQWLGTEWGRELDQSLWVKIWRAEVELRLLQDRIVVVDDCRFDNEAEAVRALGGVVVQIKRDNGAASAKGGTGFVNHKSEAGLSPSLVDYVVENVGTLEEFEKNLVQLFSKLGFNTRSQGA